MTPPDSPGYLPPAIAAQVRTALADVADPRTRSMVLGACEAAFADGHAAGYERGFDDGAAEVAAQPTALPRPVQFSGPDTIDTPDVESAPSPGPRPLPRIPHTPGEPAVTTLSGWQPEQKGDR